MVTVSVCVGSSCHIKGAYQVIEGFQKIVNNRGLNDKVEIKAAFCLGNCMHAVSVQVNGGNIQSVSPETVTEFFDTQISGRIDK